MNIVLLASIDMHVTASDGEAFGVGWNPFVERLALKVVHQEEAESLARLPSRIPNRHCIC